MRHKNNKITKVHFQIVARQREPFNYLIVLVDHVTLRSEQPTFIYFFKELTLEYWLHTHMTPVEQVVLNFLVVILQSVRNQGSCLV